MDFEVDPAVDISALPVGDRVRFTFVIDAGRFIITELDVSGGATTGRAVP